MRTTISVPDNIMSDVLKRSDNKSKSAAVAGALEEWVRLKKIQELRSLRGQMPIKADLAAQRRLDKSRR